MTAIGDKIINWIATHPTHDGANWDGWCQSKEYRECAAFGNAPSVTPTDARGAYYQALGAGQIRTDLSWEQVPDGWFAYFSTIGPHWHVADKANGVLTMASGFCTTQIHPSIGWCSSPDDYITRAGRNVGARFLGYSRTLGADGVILGSAIVPAGGGGTPIPPDPTPPRSTVSYDLIPGANNTTFAMVCTDGLDAGGNLIEINLAPSDWALMVAAKYNTAALSADQNNQYRGLLKSMLARVATGTTPTLTPVQLAAIGAAVPVFDPAPILAAIQSGDTAILTAISQVDENTLATFGLKRI